MLTVDPSKRLDLDGIINHAWIKSDNELSLNSVNYFFGKNENNKDEKETMYQDFRNLIDKIENM